MPNRFRWSVAKIVCRITNLEESLSRARPLSARRSHIGSAARAAPIAVAAGVAATASGVAEAPSVGTKLVVVFGDAGSEIASFIDQEGTEIMRKLLGLALVAGIVVGVKKYLDNNPEAKRQMKEQANKALGQAKHLAEGAGDKVKARTSRAQDQVDSFTGATTPGSTSSTSSATTPIDPATGAPTTL